MMNTFDNGFRIVKESDEDHKHWILDEMDIQYGDLFEVGPNGYFEKIGNRFQDSRIRENWENRFQDSNV
jgi:hypothetical protein